MAKQQINRVESEPTGTERAAVLTLRVVYDADQPARDIMDAATEVCDKAREVGIVTGTLRFDRAVEVDAADLRN